ncbi:hypothetical protein [Spirosoma sp. KNUC1025]|uniref:hypothetical protein n=1 Tax=Spirosoma sp. KNUC1025 TaxID=2894082 RepID=UPI00386407DD|nr:hypothetical protein LN737_26260 [Spirosoma sp. KNUC1025]
MSSYWLFAFSVILSLSGSSLAQSLAVDEYYVRVTTTNGDHFRGLFDDIDGSYLYVSTESPIPLQQIRKVTIRRKKQTTALITGAILGGLLTGYLANQSLTKNQARSPVAHGLTLTFAAAGGAAAGLLLGSAFSRVTRRVVYPLNPAEPETSLFRQLEPFSVRYQQRFFKQLPQSSQ